LNISRKNNNKNIWYIYIEQIWQIEFLSSDGRFFLSFWRRRRSIREGCIYYHSLPLILLPSGCIPDPDPPTLHLLDLGDVDDGDVLTQ
jgi:hypothetical protein